MSHVDLVILYTFGGPYTLFSQSLYSVASLALWKSYDDSIVSDFLVPEKPSWSVIHNKPPQRANYHFGYSTYQAPMLRLEYKGLQERFAVLRIINLIDAKLSYFLTYHFLSAVEIKYIVF